MMAQTIEIHADFKAQSQILRVGLKLRLALFGTLSANLHTTFK